MGYLRRRGLERLLALFLSVVILMSGLLGTATAVSGATRASRNGGTLNAVDIGLSWRSLDPQQPSQTTVAVDYSPMLQNLFTYQPGTTTIEPQLATSYLYSANHKNLTIQLRRGVRFQDGTVMNAAAVAYDIHRMAGFSACQPYFTLLTSVTEHGNYAVVLHFSAPYGAAVNILAGLVCSMIVSPTAVESEGPSGFGTDPVGTGPYKFSSQVIGDYIIWTKWAGYWDKNHSGYYSSIVLTSIGDDSSCLDAVEAGTAQMCLNGNVQDAFTAKHTRSIQIEESPATTVNVIEFNFLAAPFNNLWARKAVAQAINVPLLAKALFHGDAQATQSLLTPGIWAFEGNSNPSFPKFSVAQARSDLTHLPGDTLSVTLDIYNEPVYESVAQAIAAEVQAAGITVVVNPATVTATLSAVHSFHFDMFLGSNTSFPDPDVCYYQQFNSASSGIQLGFHDPLVDTLTNEARETITPGQRKTLYYQTGLQLGKDVAEVPLYPVTDYYFVARSLRGFSAFGPQYIEWASLH